MFVTRRLIALLGGLCAFTSLVVRAGEVIIDTPSGTVIPEGQIDREIGRARSYIEKPESGGAGPNIVIVTPGGISSDPSGGSALDTNRARARKYIEPKNGKDGKVVIIVPQGDSAAEDNGPQKSDSLESNRSKARAYANPSKHGQGSNLTILMPGGAAAGQGGTTNAGRLDDNSEKAREWLPNAGGCQNSGGVTLGMVGDESAKVSGSTSAVGVTVYEGGSCR